MKKILILLAFCGILASCGRPKYRNYTIQEKYKIVEEMCNDNFKQISEWKSNIKNITLALEKGDIQAKKEKEEWAGVVEDLGFYRNMAVSDPEIYILLGLEVREKQERHSSEGLKADVLGGFRE